MMPCRAGSVRPPGLPAVAVRPGGDVGIVLAAHALPLVGFLLIGGVWADRLPRHRVMIVTDLVRFALHALLAVLIFTAASRSGRSP